eukprot:15205393-Heterocapsa_arctica.AAC.1
MGLESESSLTSRGTKDRDQQPDEEELRGEEATAYRAVAARANYLAMERRHSVRGQGDMPEDGCTQKV